MHRHPTRYPELAVERPARLCAIDFAKAGRHALPLPLLQRPDKIKKQQETVCSDMNCVLRLPDFRCWPGYKGGTLREEKGGL